MSCALPGERLFRLRPWLIRALVPAGITGTYVLVTDQVGYVGRSDTDLRRRLLTHAAHERADYFSYSVHSDPRRAFETECASFHALRGVTSNLIHPASPAGHHLPCPFCKATVVAAQELRDTMAVLRRGGLNSPLSDNHKENS